MPPGYEWLPRGVELMTDVSEADWVVAALRPWDEQRIRVESFMPGVFGSYARMVHARDPVDGSRIPRGMLAELVSVLSGATDPPGPCWFCLWDGWGTWWKGAHGPLRAREGPRPSRSAPKTLPEAERREQRIDDERDAVLRDTPRVRTQHRAYFLLRGPLGAALSLCDVTGGEPPNLWWPPDRTWFVSTEIDGDHTNVGGSSELVSSLVASPGLSAIGVSISDPLDPGPTPVEGL